jgi:hypothetical protein
MQVAEWLSSLGGTLREPGSLVLIGSAALLWHAHNRRLLDELPDASMDVDPITDSDEIARRCYDCLIGSEFEKKHGWHVNLMPDVVLNELPPGWRSRAVTRNIGKLTLIVPQPEDLIVSKLRRGEPRDKAHYEWTRRIGLIASEIKVEPKRRL